MADNEQTEGGADAEVPKPRGKLKLIIAAVALLVIVGGAAGWFFFMRHSGEDMHAEAMAPPKPPSYVEVPDMLVNLAGQPGEFPATASSTTTARSPLATA